MYLTPYQLRAIDLALDAIRPKLLRLAYAKAVLEPLVCRAVVAWAWAKAKREARAKQSFFASPAATVLHKKHAATRFTSPCGCHVNGTRVRKMSACPSCRNKAVIVCRLDHSGAVQCKSAAGVQFFKSESAFRSWAAQRGLTVEG